MSEELKKILYIDDDEVVAEVVIMTLEDLGDFNVMYCSSGKEGLNKVLDYDPQLILLDVMMPEMDGVETFSHLQKMPEVKNIPCIFLTAKSQLHEQKHYLEIGATGVITKPFEPTELCQEIEDIWSQNREQR